MPQFSETKILPYIAQDLFDLVLDVEKYPQFLPWADKAHVYSHEGESFFADLTIGYKLLSETYTSRVTFCPHLWIHVEATQGPFKWLKTQWRFEEISPTKTSISFHIDFAFKSSLFSSMFSSVFNQAAPHILGAFEQRAEALLAQQDF